MTKRLSHSILFIYKNIRKTGAWCLEFAVFDSKNLIYKNPFGALPEDRECRFSVDVRTEEHPEKVLFVYRKDEDETPVFLEMERLNEKDGFTRFSVSLSISEKGLYFYFFEILTPSGKLILKKDDGVEWQLTVYDKNFKTPDWATGKVMYQIFPDRFCRSDNYMQRDAKNERKIHENWYEAPDFIYDTPDYKGNDYFCGNLRGICERIPYLKNLGVDIIYLNPIFESPENHRYSTGDYTKIDPYLGTNEDFEELCRECEKQGIKIVIDGVFSHTGADSVYFNKFNHYESNGAYNSESSPFYNWYTFNESKAGYECWWGFPNLPNVNETNPEYMEFITGKDGILSMWQKRGASGWRLDVADELPDEFLDALCKRVKIENSDALIIGEVWEDATNKFSYGVRRRYLLGDQLDSVMNYPWRTAVIDYIKEGNAQKFREDVLTIAENYPEPALSCLMNILSTHDTERIINVFGVEKEVEHKDAKDYKLTDEEYNKGKEMFKRAAFLQFALPGVPSIYYGDEVGLTGFRDPYCRMCYPFGREDAELFGFFKKLSSVRHEYIENYKMPIENFVTQNKTVMFKRGKLTFVINMSEYEENIKINSEFVTIYGKESVFFEDGNIKIYPFSFGILLEK